MSTDGVVDPLDQFALARRLTERTTALCQGLAEGQAPLLELVTPVTAELLLWWFGDEAVASRGGWNFHAGQRQAILNAIVAHEVVGADSLKTLYEAVAPEALLARLDEIAAPGNDHPKYCVKMATGTGKTWVLMALLVWQLLNKTAALGEGRDDARFTRHFLVVAPGLIVYERLLDAFCGRRVAGGSGERHFETSDLVANAELFVPEPYRETVFAFVRGNVCAKENIGLQATGNGLIAITNWHLLVDAEPELEAEEAEAVQAPGVALPADEVARAVLPITPGRAAGNSLDVLDRRWARGNVLAYLAELPDLMVFNDEAHHIHEVKRGGESAAAQWQKSLDRMAEHKGRRFLQVDFSATPFDEAGTPKKRRRRYFPHIIVDFDLKAAMRAGLVKSLVLDRRKEVGALPLDFRAERDDDGSIAGLSEGQRVMLRAGLTKLRKLEQDFARTDASRRPKMMVVCEDTNVSPRVLEFLTTEEGLDVDDVLAIDSGRKAELGEQEWARVREKLFDVDHHAQPRVIVSVLMLREGFDVSNICVIVPLRSSQAQILLEQTIGRGLRLMWRESEFDAIKQENRERINAGREPNSLLDVLSIVEHPAFLSFYEDLQNDGLVGTTTEISDGSDAAGDMVSVGLREDYRQFDFGVPFILREAEEMRGHAELDVHALPPFTALTREKLSELVGKGDTFVSQDLQSATLFGDYKVNGAVMTVGGYNDYLTRMTRRISQALSTDLPRSNKVADHAERPYMQGDTAELAGWLDDYVREVLFGGPFEPLENENWRLLLLDPVVHHITEKFGSALLEAEEHALVGSTEVRLRQLSEVDHLMMRESRSVEVGKCIYTRLAWPAHGGGLEKEFIAWAQADADVLAFCKISETRHTFARLRYVKEDGLPAFYSPDFVVRTRDAVYLVETKAQQQLVHPNVQRKRKAALAWCARVNELSEDERQSPPWHYVLLGEDAVHEWHDKGEHLAGLLDFARLRSQPSAAQQVRLL